MNVEDIVRTIKKDFPEDRVCELLDDEILNWVEDGWEAEADSEYEWYCDHCNGEAEGVVLDRMIRYWQKRYNTGRELDENTSSDVVNKLINAYEIFRTLG